MKRAEARWRKSSYSLSQGECVEVAANAFNAVAIRDSKRQHGPVLVVSRRAFRALIRR